VSRTTFGDGEVCAPGSLAGRCIHLALHPEGMGPGFVSGPLVEPRRGQTSLMA